MQTKDCQWKKGGCWSLSVHNKKNVEIIEKKAQKSAPYNLQMCNL